MHHVAEMCLQTPDFVHSDLNRLVHLPPSFLSSLIMAFVIPWILHLPQCMVGVKVCSDKPDDLTSGDCPNRNKL